MTLAPPRTVVDGLMFGEGPRWHEGALVFSDMHAPHRPRRAGERRRPLRVSTVLEVTDDEPSGLGWLPDGRMLVVAMETQRLLRLEPDGTLVEHADLSSLARGSLNDMIVATDGTEYVGDMGVRIQEGGEASPARPSAWRPTARCRAAADDLQSPNGHVLTDDGRTLIVAESGGALTAFDVRDDGTLDGRRVYAARPGLRRRPGGRARRDLPRRRGKAGGGQLGAAHRAFPGRGHRHDRLRRRDPGGLRARWTRPSHAPDVRGRRLEARRGAAAPVGPHRRLRRGNTGRAAPDALLRSSTRAAGGPAIGGRRYARSRERSACRRSSASSTTSWPPTAPRSGSPTRRRRHSHSSSTSPSRSAPSASCRSSSSWRSSRRFAETGDTPPEITLFDPREEPGWEPSGH